MRNLIKLMVDDLIKNTKKNLEKFKIKKPEDIENNDVKIVSFSDEMLINEKKLKKFLRKKMYFHPRIKSMTIKAKKIISDLFDLFVHEPSLMPENWNNHKTENEKFLNVSDYISGMTDKYAINTHSKFFDLYSF